MLDSLDSLECGKIVFFTTLITRLHFYLLKLPTCQINASRKNGEELPEQLISLFHSIIISLFAFLKIIGLTSRAWIYYLSQSIIVGYFIYHWHQSKIKWDASAFSRFEGNNNDKIKTLAHPKAVAFHHIIATLYLYGFLLVDQFYATFSFAIGEIPIIFINLSWFMKFFDHTDTRMYIIIKQFASVTYAIRIATFAITFVFFGLPNIKFSILDIIKILALILIFLLNLIWLFKVYKGDKTKVLIIIIRKIIKRLEKEINNKLN
jgi:hypothetical protein